ncbi:MAG: Glu/Leu/Phe/Val dehydrogenase [Deltaproteobacteria bacterium]|jgi:glutamate dehydrogenase (NAD(P)+)|nr:Glu/Leu/Phe/Val dehydrogenase [Deltaproteobacteria bacterium]
MKDVFSYADELGPAKIIHVYEPAVNLKAVLVIDNVAKGPSIGGIRMAEDVSTEECFRLARAMTFKNAAAGLPHGGGKIVVYGDPKMVKAEKEKILRALASSLRNEEDYIFAPDMGTDEECMAWIRDEVGRVVGLPRELGGIPLDEVGATGWGLSHVTDVALQFCDFEIAGARVVIQGFGAVGKNAALFLRDRGAVLVATCDTGGAVYNAAGLDIEALMALKAQGRSVAEYSGGKTIENDALLDIACDIWIPAARPDVIHDDNVGRLNTRLVVEGANIPITLDAEIKLHERGILCVPDFIANAGGVICAAMEYRGSNKTAVFQTIEEKLRRNTRMVLDRMKNESVLPRQAAVELATERVQKAMGFRRFSLFSTAPGFT